MLRLMLAIGARSARLNRRNPIRVVRALKTIGMALVFALLDMTARDTVGFEINSRREICPTPEVVG